MRSNFTFLSAEKEKKSSTSFLAPSVAYETRFHRRKRAKVEGHKKPTKKERKMYKRRQKRENYRTWKGVEGAVKGGLTEKA